MEARFDPFGARASAFGESGGCRPEALARLERLSGLGAWCHDPKGGQVRASAQVYEVLGLSPDIDLDLETVLARFVSPKARQLLLDRLAALSAGGAQAAKARPPSLPLSFDATIATPAGQLRRVRLRAEVDGGASGTGCVIGTLRDVTHENRDRQRLWQAANIDDLTGLANQRWFQRRLQLALNEGTALALVLLDLDGFAQMSDQLGAVQSDAVLREIAERLSGLVGDEGMVARIAGEEFVLMRAGPDTDDLAQALADGAFAALEEPFSIAASAGFALHAAAGMATSPTDAKDSEGLMRCLRQALAEVKQMGPLTHAAFLRGPTRARFEARREAIAFVLAAAKEGRVRAYYQPKVSFATGQVVAHEALARIIGRDGKVSGPEQWGAALDDVDCARHVDAAVLQAVLDDLKRDAGRLHRVGVNFSEHSLRCPVFADRLLQEIAARGLVPDLIEVEVIETVLVGERMQPLSQGFARLRAAGIRIALDDFGTGFASLSHLRDLPIDRIKLDKSFVLGLGADARNAPILRAIIELAHALGLETVAEGVETEEAVAFLRALNCGEGQGYHFGMAQPFEALPSLNV
ncbi:diguanylate cyclase (GGDEF)-like protein [Rhodobacter aestuarii]|uniref:Diguanylate cyclase (GGDEF) domain-containing protein n=1 Tax=Rhodobacter aestuarii TaxID=453582 RepID=A0A1N7IUB5_9RHOB|nr:bifunctional diguanylate cyclase/phosphodiesterase [Rhodobacter aestuarii]PTV97520.1 diguanylate cyclase (GGDEF)-like protein [Rhodobacter aestuarii]SIS40683.1 diguanylate cyclase (GGDEF) domain-containing protein [Rhodobacter aestuarii]